MLQLGIGKRQFIHVRIWLRNATKSADGTVVNFHDSRFRLNCENASICFLNGVAVSLDAPGEVPDDASLLHALRGPFGLSGPRFGCGAEQCGCCMVLVDGEPACSCTLAASAVGGRAVVTVEGLGTAAAPHPLQAAFLAEQAG